MRGVHCDEGRGLLVDGRFPKCIDHGILIASSAVSPASVVLDHALYPPPHLRMKLRVRERLTTFVACELDACEEPERLCIVHSL